MSTRIRVRDDRVEITTAPDDSGRSDALVERAPLRTALVEAAGAQLTWDVTAPTPLPDADVHDTLAASAWLADVYGAAIADAVFRGTDAVFRGTDAVLRAVDAVAARDGSADAAIVEAVHALGHLNWARAWWPASSGIPALDPAIVAAETAVTSHLLTHLLDDDEAVEHAMNDAHEASAALAALPPALAADAAELVAVLDALAEDHGVVWAAATPADLRSEWALAAGGERRAPTADGVVIAQGTAPVRWSDVPARTVDAAAEARWTLVQGTEAPSLHVEVPAVHGVLSTPELHALFGPPDGEVHVVLRRTDSMFAGERVVPASALFLPPGARTLRVHDPLLVSPDAPEAAESAEDRAEVLAFATSRLVAPDASLAERAAGMRA